MNTQSQNQFVEEKLRLDGHVSRNWALKHYITRLASRILDLKAKGWDFKPEREDGDYVYVVTKQPELTLSA